ncbi:hypothetical protein Terro_1553 [Terriglobus roseus DSM 18391]|uniref:Secretin/TonB short N-terminal domain-containing protein n=1 Tax=Terriglobus roseus (strain DSM 18391 / NRRL B-41598 / KBS 63) TaxID=926566 RepID=I3ZF42_TERRK|nr:hypothetical protein [Terriglobus roseus]AFL87860.1 hypothetical protein Terro_1553 [Terriglobus roseus DSM 18391]
MTQRSTLIRRSLRLTAFAVSTVSAAAFAAQAKPSAAIPATAPTQSVSDLPSARPAVKESTPRGEAQVTWNGGKLTVNAGGSALPEILQQIARQTGMKITGGVPDERVFGTYGPGSVQAVMSQLFDGLAINMMLVNGNATTPKELVLTTRTGAASPPQVREVSNDEDFRRTPSPGIPIVQRPGRTFGSRELSDPNPNGPGGQPPMPDGTGGATPNSTPPDTTTDPAAGADQQQSPNGVRTPEQIFEELRRRQQQQQNEPQ